MKTLDLYTEDYKKNTSRIIVESKHRVSNQMLDELGIDLLLLFTDQLEKLRSAGAHKEVAISAGYLVALFDAAALSGRLDRSRHVFHVNRVADQAIERANQLIVEGIFE